VRDETEMDIVRAIFKLAERGETGSEIARALAKQGRARRNGKRWTQRQVTSVLARGDFYKEGMLRYGEARGQNKSLALIQSDAVATER
jgi:hypothetical protein